VAKAKAGDRRLVLLDPSAAALRDLFASGMRLEALALWVGVAPAFSVTYPDLESAVDLVEEGPSGATGRRPSSTTRRSADSRR